MDKEPKELIVEIKKIFPKTFKKLQPLPIHASRMSCSEETSISNECKLKAIRLVTKLLGCVIKFDYFIQDFKSGQEVLFKGWEVVHESPKYVFIQNQEHEALVFSKDIMGEVKFCYKLGLNGSSFVYTLSSLVKTIELNL